MFLSVVNNVWSSHCGDWFSGSRNSSESREEQRQIRGEQKDRMKHAENWKENAFTSANYQSERFKLKLTEASEKARNPFEIF